ncbi:hypothetical protein CSUB01_10258 [Colletotrichum sublineola]|uniref:Asl1-like glycosyl hydrolase catalytic domain-containing protein n=1 Tax=Colletotrichum sublineola TaxID=1173701 RepID=A0A066XRZ3_COLSU|nr:hypothetical protein CSUB01_10258 [Colletotrichum sublineola]
MPLIRLLLFFAFASLTKHVLASGEGTCYTSAFQDEMSSRDQCPCPRPQGPFTTSSSPGQEVSPTSLTKAQPTSVIDPPRLNVDVAVANAVSPTTMLVLSPSSQTGYSAPSHSLDFVPILWGPIAVHTERWPQNADAMISRGSTHSLSFNECDISDQCNLNAVSAATEHVKFVNGYAGRVKIGSPAISNGAIAGQGLSWLELWVSTCDSLGCKYDFCVTHWYGYSVENLLDHLASVHRICRGKPVWLTEFAIQNGSDEQHATFITAVVPQLDAIDYLERYAYFMIQEGRFVSVSTITSSGEAYAKGLV